MTAKNVLVIPKDLKEVPYPVNPDPKKCKSCSKTKIDIPCTYNARQGYSTCGDVCQINLDKILLTIENNTGRPLTVFDLTAYFDGSNEKYNNILNFIDVKRKEKKEETKKEIMLMNYNSNLNDSEIGKWAQTLKNDIPNLIKTNPNDMHSLLKEIDDFAKLRINAKKITSQDTADLKELILKQREKLNKVVDKEIQKERDRNSSITSSDTRNNNESERISTESSHIGHQSTNIGSVKNLLKRKLEDEDNNDIHVRKKSRVEKSVDKMNIDSESWNNNYSVFEKPEDQIVNQMELDESIDSLENQISLPVNGPKRLTPNGQDWKSFIYQGVPIFFKPNPKKNAKCKQLYWVSFTYGGDHEWLRLHDYKGGKHHRYQYSDFDMNNFFRKDINTEKNIWYSN